MQTGGCLCGAIRYEVDRPMKTATYCHCSRCRRWHGHVGAYCGADRDAFRLTESRGLKWYSVEPNIKRGFCAECGSSVLFDEVTLPKISLCTGTLDAPTGVQEKAHIYVASKGDYYEIVDGLPAYDTFPA
jgi:hypothetical protein